VLARAAADPTGLVELALCAELEQHRLLKLAPDTVQLLEQNDWLEAFERNPGQRSANFTEDQYLLQLPPPLLSAHAQPLARTLLTLDDPVRVQYLLYRLPIGVVIAYLYAVSNDSQSFGPKLVAAICAATVRADGQLPRNDPSRQIGEYIAGLLAGMEGADPARATFLAVWHDSQEIRVGDIPYLGRRYLQAASNEQVTEDQTAGLPSEVFSASMSQAFTA
jgi:hypothetical protein